MSGILLVLSVLLPLLALIIISRGNFSGIQASIRSIEGVGEEVDVLRRTFPVSTFNVLLALVSFGMLTLLLWDAGERGLSLLAFNLFLFSQIFMIFQGTFHSSVTVWAAKELSQTGSVPELFEPLWRWMYSTVQEVYVNVGLLAFAAFGWAILRSGLLPAWLGWALIGWAIIWLILFLFQQDNLPIILFVPPLVIGFTAIFA